MHKVNNRIGFNFHYSPPTEKRRKTTAVLFVDGKEYSNTIVLFTKDRFNKQRARKIALSNVMALSPLTKLERTEVWKFFIKTMRLC